MLLTGKYTLHEKLGLGWSGPFSSNIFMESSDVNKEELMEEIDSVEVWSVFNRMWVDERIQESFKAEEISEADKKELYSYVADLMDGPPY